MIEKKLAKIVDLLNIKLDFFYSRTQIIDQIKAEPIDNHISMEVRPLNSQLYSEKDVISTSNDNKEM